MGGGGVAVDLTGGASSGGNQQNQWGDMHGSQMTMSSKGINPFLVLGVVSLLVTTGVTVWATSQKK